MVTFGLVHGSQHGAWCWERSTPELERRGHRVVAPDLPCDDPAVGVDGYATVVIEALEGADDVVLVGHSLGSLTIPVVASRRPVDRMVFLCSVPTGPGPAIDGDLADMVTPGFLRGRAHHRRRRPRDARARRRGRGVLPGLHSGGCGVGPGTPPPAEPAPAHGGRTVGVVARSAREHRARPRRRRGEHGVGGGRGHRAAEWRSAHRDRRRPFAVHRTSGRARRRAAPDRRVTDTSVSSRSTPSRSVEQAPLSVPLSVLDLAPVGRGSSPAQALRNSVALPRGRATRLHPSLGGRAPQHARHRELVPCGAARASRRRDVHDPCRLGWAHVAEPRTARGRRAVRHARSAASGSDRPRHRARAGNRSAHRLGVATLIRGRHRRRVPRPARPAARVLRRLVAGRSSVRRHHRGARRGVQAGDLAPGLEHVETRTRRVCSGCRSRSPTTSRRPH